MEHSESDNTLGLQQTDSEPMRAAVLIVVQITERLKGGRTDLKSKRSRKGFSDAKDTDAILYLEGEDAI